ncbi:MAG TPA: SWIM zinc finger family protein, partial [Calditrichia bacterium]|nr:SWIM zinc finger family protein [Calditrichia bacterium]
MKKLPKNLAWLRKIPEEDYEFFFEEKILERGANYFESGNVERLALTRSGEIVGKVRGTRIYYVSISSCGDGDIDPDCSCPYESNCKHAAAVLMAFEEHCAKGKDLEILADDDPFLLRMNAELWDFDEDGSLSPVRREELHDFLKNMSKKEIIALIEEWQEQIPEVARDLLERRKLQSGNVQSILIDLQAEIDAVTEEPGWRNHWSSDGFTPDYGGIRRRLRLLLDQDQADGILSISGHFFESAIEQVGMSDDEGETAMEVQGCIPLFLEALEKSSLSGAKRLIWAVDKLLADDFGVMDELRVVVERDYPPQDWLTLAEFLKELMAEFPEDPHQEHRSGDFQRKMI